MKNSLKLKFNREEVKNNFKLFLNKTKNKKNDINNNPNKEFYTEYKGSFKQFYKNSYVLGQGTLGTVKLTKKWTNNKLFAVKIINTRDEEIIYQIIEEYKHLKNLSNENIIKVEDLYIDLLKGKVYWIMEYFESLELFDFISNLENYNENITKNLFKKLLWGIRYLHSKGIVHRDLKPNNILVSNDGKALKIADFNIAKFTDTYNNFDALKSNNYKMMTYTGTIAFNAPEIFSHGYYTESVDYWSAGCILYTMLIGKQPFYKIHVKDLIDQIKNNDYDKKCKEWHFLTKKTKNLIEGFLNIDPLKRLKISEALIHNWFNTETNIQFNNLSKIINENSKKLIKKKINYKKNKTDTESISYFYRSKTIRTDLNLEKIS